MDVRSAGLLVAPNSDTNQAGPPGWRAEAIDGRSRRVEARERASWSAHTATLVGLPVTGLRAPQ